MLDDFSRHQQGIIKRYYANIDKIGAQKLAELVTELYLAEGKKLEKHWKSAETLMTKMEVAPERIRHIMARKDPAILAKLVSELMEG